MHRNWLIAILFGLFILQSTIVKWLIPVSWQMEANVAPQLTLVVVLLIGLYGDRHLAMVHGLAFGLLQDIVFYGPMIGTYTFNMGLLGYLAGLLGLRKTSGLVSGLFAVCLLDFLFQWILFGLYRLFQMTHTSVEWTVLRQMLPSLLVDMLFALLIYVPIRRLLELTAVQEEPDET